MSPSDLPEPDLTIAKARAERNQGYYRRLRRLFPVLLVLVALVYTLTVDFVPSESMQPTLKPGDHILTLRAWLAYPMHRVPSRNDVVLFELPATKAPSHDSETAQAATQTGSPSAQPQGREQIGVFRTHGEILVKRVIGLPGETVQYAGGRVLINGKPIADAHQVLDDGQYIYPYAGDAPVQLKPDELFVLGDNRTNSDDSRYIGPIKVKSVIGRHLKVLYHTKPPPSDN